MSKICTTLAQSKELMELGLNPETADMHWFGSWSEWNLDIIPYKDVSLPKYITAENKGEFILPAWSLSTLIDLIPAATFLQEVNDMCYGSIEIDNKDLMEEAREGFGSSTIKTIKADNLFDVVYGLVAWYLTNKR